MMLSRWTREPMLHDGSGASSSKCHPSDIGRIADDGTPIKHILVCDATFKRQLKNNARIRALHSDSGLSVVNFKGSIAQPRTRYFHCRIGSTR